jgi:hypothetical protein
VKISSASTSPRVERNVYISAKRIKSYGSGNDYPQKVLQIINSSGTGTTCIEIYISFVAGSGFVDLIFAGTVINERGERVSSLLTKFAKDLKHFNGFACLVKFNAFSVPYAYYNIPFEQCRLEINPDGSYTGKIAIHPDWTGIYGKSFKNTEIQYIDRFDINQLAGQIAEAGGPENYLGQVFYFTYDGDWEYPISPFDPIVTDMLTEESVSTVKHRNAKYNFLPSGILVRKGIKPVLKDNGEPDPDSSYNQEQQESAAMIRRMQGDMNTSKIWVVDIDSDEEMPEWIDFTAKNYDRQFELTEKTVQENIGKMFKVPPILRGIDIGAGFGADLMTNAYNFMNSVTGSERQSLQIAFRDLFTNHPGMFTDFTIKPLTYIL